MEKQYEQHIFETNLAIEKLKELQKDIIRRKIELGIEQLNYKNDNI